jgi:two-component system sensor histidine kinase RegB
LRDTELSQLGKRPLDQSDGEGIGLYLTQMIVERYQGELHFERAENETRAEIRLPKSVMEAPTHE